MNTKISYLYRDADNYKMHNKCVIAGMLTTEQARTIKDSCEMGEYFIPRQVGLPERRFDRYDPAVDHCWFELDEDCFSETIEPPMRGSSHRSTMAGSGGVSAAWLMNVFVIPCMIGRSGRPMYSHRIFFCRVN